MMLVVRLWGGGILLYDVFLRLLQGMAEFRLTSVIANMMMRQRRRGRRKKGCSKGQSSRSSVTQSKATSDWVWDKQTRLVSWLSIMKLCTCFSALVSSSLRASTATTNAVQPEPFTHANIQLQSHRVLAAILLWSSKSVNFIVENHRPQHAAHGNETQLPIRDPLSQ